MQLTKLFLQAGIVTVLMMSIAICKAAPAASPNGKTAVAQPGSTLLPPPPEPNPPAVPRPPLDAPEPVVVAPAVPPVGPKAP